MGNPRGLRLHLIFICAFLFAGATYTTCLGDGNTSLTVCSEKERLALLKFKHSVEDPSGMLSTWVGDDCCIWGGIHCDATIESLHLRGCWGSEDMDDGCYLSGNEVNSSLAELRHLKHLDLSGNDFQRSCIPEFIGSLKQLSYLNLSHSGFGGIIPPHIGNEVNFSLAELRHLKYLDLSGNDFRWSPIPEFIGSLKQLSYLNLSNAVFQGNIPHHIGNLSNLKVLDLSSNGGLMADDMAWTSGLSSLEHLDLSLVDLGGAQNMDMVFYMIPSLKELSLSDCGLSNADIGHFLNSSRILPNIRHLDLSLNSFKGSLPGFFENMSSLTFLDLSYFNLSSAWNFANLLSTIPSLSELHLSYCGLDKTHLSSSRLNFSTLSNIQHLVLKGNSIEGPFPSFFTNMSSLRVLDLSENMLNSSVPIMPNLLELYLSSNQFKQIGDVGIWRQCHLKQLHASNNHFEIEMINSPKNLSECSQYALEWLDLSRCSIGIIPESFGRLANLRGIDISSSRLTGLIPKSLGRLRFLEVLDLSNNQLSGPIPRFLGNLSKLDLSNNQLNGSITESFGNLAALTYLDLRSNRLTGPIPTSIGQLSRLHYLDSSNNFLEGVVFEAHFANLSMLKYLDTSSNTRLTFNVSREWTPPFQLITLRLSSCNIVTEFPQWLRNQRKLGSLELSNATISGPLPRWLRKMPIIPFLDLSHNKLSGPLTNLPNGATYGPYGFVPVLFLKNNRFNESIPSSLCRRIDLEYLDLSRNRLTGEIPKCLENLQGLYAMILSSNRLSGGIPSSVGLNSLIRLKLNDNNFVGELPRELGNLPDLNILDVGDNKLCGNVPEWVGEKLTDLIVLRLHKNNFTGRIPETLCKASNLQILDVAHNNLEGHIPRCLGELNAMVNSSGYGAGDSYEHDENVDQVMKGVDLEYSKIWDLVYNMDLSSNQLVGEIPGELTALSMLGGLNLSNNHLTGGIPYSIGNMMKLESLDLSGNKLTGGIPPSMADLTFLSHLNLSHNNLSGRIPTGRQLQTLIDPSIYEGNKDLCGPPLPRNCSNQENPTTKSKKKQGAADEKTEVLLFYVDIICGFATGFWGVIGVLLFKKQWRQKIYMFAEEVMEKIYVALAVVVRVAKIKGRREAT